MRLGLAISLFIHALLIGWGVATIAATEKLEAPKTPVIEARLVTVGEFTNLRKGDPRSTKMDAKPVEAKKKAEKKAKKPPKPKAPPPPAAPPPPDPIAEKLRQEAAKKKAAEEAAKKKAAAEAALKKKKAEDAARRRKAAAEKKKKAEAARKKKAEAERKKKLAAKKKRERERRLAEAKKRAAKKKFDPDAIRQALLDKTPEKRGGPKERARAGERDGTGDQLTAREQDLILSRISTALGACWRLPGAGGGVRVPVVVLRWQMRSDGTVKGAPIVVENPGGTLARQAEEAAKRAVACVGQFDLPRKHYKSWRVVEFAFDPTAMISGGY